MPIRLPRGWEIAERHVTPEAVMLGRRAALAGAIGLGLGGKAFAQAATTTGTAAANSAPLGAAGPVNPTYKPGRDITDEKIPDGPTTTTMSSANRRTYGGMLRR